MNWCDERYVRVFVRDTADWLAFSFEAQALIPLIMRKLDRSGVLELGKHGLRGVAIAIGHANRWPELEAPLEELLADGCFAHNGNRLVMRNFLEAQECAMSDKLRKAESRERRRDESRDVTKSHERSRAVTNGHSVPSVPVRSGPSVPSRSLSSSPTLPGVMGTPREVTKKLRAKPTGDHAAFMAKFHELYKARSGEAPVITNVEGRIASTLLKAIGLPAALSKLEAAFAGDHWWAKAGAPIDLKAISQHVNTLVAKAPSSPVMGPDEAHAAYLAENNAWAALHDLAGTEERLRAKGVAIPWLSHPVRRSMKHDKAGRELEACT